MKKFTQNSNAFFLIQITSKSLSFFLSGDTPKFDVATNSKRKKKKKQQQKTQTNNQLLCSDKYY